MVYGSLSPWDGLSLLELGPLGALLQPPTPTSSHPLGVFRYDPRQLNKGS